MVEAEEGPTGRPPRDFRQEALDRYEDADLDELIERGRAAQEWKKAKELSRRAAREKAIRDQGGCVWMVDGVDRSAEPSAERTLSSDYPLESLLEVEERLGSKAQEPDRSVARLVARWLEQEETRMRAGRLGEKMLAMLRLCAHHLRDWLGADGPVECLDESKLLDMHSWLSKQVQSGKWSVGYAKRIFDVAKRLIRFAWELRLIELPRKLDNSGLSFTVPAKPVQTFTVEEVRTLYQKIPGQSKLHLLLMLNCGFQGADINNLRHEEVDWEQGVITRKRTKTKGQANVPVVRYKLWPETFALLKVWRSQDKNFVLLTKKGNRWIKEYTREDGTLARSDNVGSTLDYWLARCGIKRCPQKLRATAATMLAQHPTFKFYAGYFLGHSPQGISQKHYVKPSDGEFFEALDWLRERLLG